MTGDAGPEVPCAKENEEEDGEEEDRVARGRMPESALLVRKRCARIALLLLVVSVLEALTALLLVSNFQRTYGGSVRSFYVPATPLTPPLRNDPSDY